MGVITDEGLVPDPDVIIANLHTEFDGLLKTAQEGGRTPSLKEAVDRLGKTLVALDAVLDDDARKGQALSSRSPDRCQATTKAGEPCKNRPLPGSAFCHVHQ
jgi:hypothetical protein